MVVHACRLSTALLTAGTMCGFIFWRVRSSVPAMLSSGRGMCCILPHSCACVFFSHNDGSVLEKKKCKLHFLAGKELGLARKKMHVSLSKVMLARMNMQVVYM